MNVISTMVGLSIMGAASPVMLDMSLAPLIAQKRAQNLGIAESAAVTYAAHHEGASQLSDNTPDGCDLTETATLAYEITCTEGEGKYRMSAKRSFRLLDAGAAGNLGVYSDNDMDGFDDVTGLPTHYWECYSGWKGSSSDSLKNNCDLGGKYVIPAYASLYN